MIHSIVTNDIFLLITGICSIVGFIVSIFIAKKIININNNINTDNSMNIKNQNITADNGGKAAGRDLKYEKPDTEEYTIERKIDHNGLLKYRSYFDDYMENYNIVSEKIRIISSADPMIENKLIKYIRNKYINISNDKATSNEILDKIVKEIENDLKESCNLSLDDIAYAHYIVFYVFARCKIFKKPPPKKG